MNFVAKHLLTLIYVTRYNNFIKRQIAAKTLISISLKCVGLMTFFVKRNVGGMILSSASLSKPELKGIPYTNIITIMWIINLKRLECIQ